MGKWMNREKNSQIEGREKSKSVFLLVSREEAWCS